MPLRPLLFAAVAATCLALAAPAAAKTTWLCAPGLQDSACSSSLTTTLYSPAGKQLRTATPKAGRSKKFDCFYVYPTVSDQKRLNATLAKDPEIKAIARFQAARYGQHCRVFAPVYRQLTLQGIGETTKPADAQKGIRTAYASVEAAWKDYLKNHNKGRGVLVIGHSQGAGLASRLVRKQIDRKPSVRKRLIGAYLLGGNVTVKKGSDRGGSFRNVRACRKAGQVGCVVAFSTYNQTPPAGSRFGRPGGPFATVFGQGSGKGLRGAVQQPRRAEGRNRQADVGAAQQAVPHHDLDRAGQHAGRLHRAGPGHDLRRVPRGVLGPLLVGRRRALAAGQPAGRRARAQADPGRIVGPAPPGRQHRAG